LNNDTNAADYNYIPTTLNLVWTLRICGEYLTLDPEKDLWKEYVFEPGQSWNTVDDDEAGMDDVSAHFESIMYDTNYCPLTSYQIFTYDQDTGTFSEFTDTNYIYWDANDLEFHYKTNTAYQNTYYIKAMTDGDIMREYEKIKITVCGLETLTVNDADPYVVTFVYEPVYNDAAIEWSEIQTWFTFDANT
jgi:hypothetical protein